MMNPYERVKLSRERTAATFPLPTPRDCIRYAITELAEYDDALLRLERAGDKRNNARQPDPQAELGQCVYMLLSAAVQTSGPPEYYPVLPDVSVVWYADTLKWLADMLQGFCDGFSALAEELSRTYSALVGIASFHGWDMTSLVEDTCAAFEAKHGTVAP
jgi:hypothetical protein